MTVSAQSAAMSRPVGDARRGEPFAPIVRLVRITLGVSHAAVVLAGAERSWLHTLPGLTVTHPARLHPFLAGAMGRRGALSEVADASAEPEFDASPLPDAPGARGIAAVPLVLGGGESVGVLLVADAAPRRFSSREHALLVEFAECVVRELELSRSAASDDLTSFLSRKPFFQDLAAILSASRANGAMRDAATLAILDLDHFKLINDRHGHPAGDFVLAAVAETCRGALGGGVSYGRLGGEEFAFAFPGVDVEAAAEALSGARRAIEAIRFDALPELRVTASIGAAGLSDDIVNASAWCKMADAALYGAKQAGRNCVIVSSRTVALPSGGPTARRPRNDDAPARHP